MFYKVLGKGRFLGQILGFQKIFQHIRNNFLGYPSTKFKKYFNI